MSDDYPLELGHAHQEIRDLRARLRAAEELLRDVEWSFVPTAPLPPRSAARCADVCIHSTPPTVASPRGWRGGSEDGWQSNRRTAPA